jgi:branched-chain amino acid transport system substrate-binding protein
MRIIIARAAILVFLAALWSAGARAEDAKPIVVGVLTDMSGSSMDLAGPGSFAATQMAVEDFGGSVLGRPVQVISGDHQLKADVGAAVARDWYDTKGVELIVDVPVSAVGLAVQGISKEKHKLFITSGTLTSDFTSKFCSPYSMQWNFDTTALANSTMRTELQLGLKSWFFLTADYAFGEALQRDATKVIVADGGTVVGSVRHPFNNPDLTSFVVQALASDAQGIALANGPPDNVTALKEAAEFGLASSGKTMAGLFFIITDIRALGLKAAQGLTFTEAFYWNFDDATRAWSQRFYTRMGKMPTSAQAADYSSVTHWLKAVQTAGTLDAASVAEKMRATPVEDVFARHGHLRPDGAMVHDLYLVKVLAPEQSHGPWDVYQVLATVPGDTSFPRIEDEDCPLTK